MEIHDDIHKRCFERKEDATLVEILGILVLRADILSETHDIPQVLTRRNDRECDIGLINRLHSGQVIAEEYLMAVEFTKENFESEVLKSDTPVLVDFWAPWCGPCQIMGPVIDQLSGELTTVKIGKLNVDEHPDVASEYGVMSIPTMKVFKGGAVVKEFVGVQEKESLKTALSAV